MGYLIKSLDDLEDKLAECRETALLFPEIATSHNTIGFFDTQEEADVLSLAASTYYNDWESVSVNVEDFIGLFVVQISYTLSPEEIDECHDAFCSYMEDTGKFDNLEDGMDRLIRDMNLMDLTDFEDEEDEEC